MNGLSERKVAAILVATFAAVYFIPVGQPRFDQALTEALALTRWYAREHVVLCLLPTFWVAGAIGVFVSQAAVMRYLGPKASKPLAYGVGSISGTLLAVCSCTVLPLFAGIYRMGAGLGPAAAFLYSGPAINALAIIVTAKVLGVQLGLVRAVSAVVFAIGIGIAMAFFFRKDESKRTSRAVILPDPPVARPLWQTALFFGVMVGILVFANWGAPSDGGAFFSLVYGMKWTVIAFLALVLSGILWKWQHISPSRIGLVITAVTLTAILLPDHPVGPFLAGIIGLGWLTKGQPGEAGEWFEQTWSFTRQIMPLLLVGVLTAGFLLGRPGGEGMIPSAWIAGVVGTNSGGANLFAAGAGAAMYFATLTEVPILQGLLGNGMNAGPALALLLAGPALSLPNMLVIHSIIGFRKTAVYVALVIILATGAGWGYGFLVAG